MAHFNVYRLKNPGSRAAFRVMFAPGNEVRR